MRPLNPEGVPPPFANYSHGIEACAKRVVAVSGQLGIDLNGTVPGGAEAQAALCFGHIEAILAEAGLGPRNVLRLNAYVTDRAHMAGYMAARDVWLAHSDHRPASTLMIVVGFTRPEFVVEVEALAAAED